MTTMIHLAVLFIRKELNQHNRYYAQMNDMVATLQENATDLLDECSSSRLQYILRRLNRLQEETQMLREYASQVSSEYQAQVDLGQNRIMKLLTIVTTIFMPLSLIAGWYGMNFDCRMVWNELCQYAGTSLGLWVSGSNCIECIDRWRLHFLLQEKAVLVNGNALE